MSAKSIHIQTQLKAVSQTVFYTLNTILLLLHSDHTSGVLTFFVVVLHVWFTAQVFMTLRLLSVTVIHLLSITEVF